jgi:hypothetical protein
VLLIHLPNAVFFNNENDAGCSGGSTTMATAHDLDNWYEEIPSEYLGKEERKIKTSRNFLLKVTVSRDFYGLLWLYYIERKIIFLAHPIM